MSTGQHRVAAQVRAKLDQSNRGRGEVAGWLGTSRSAASRKINGHVAFTVPDLFAIAGALDLDPAVFLADIPADSLTP